jgi:hypothetical protein
LTSAGQAANAHSTDTVPAMPPITFDISMSLDSYVAGPEPSHRVAT